MVSRDHWDYPYQLGHAIIFSLIGAPHIIWGNYNFPLKGTSHIGLVQNADQQVTPVIRSLVKHTFYFTGKIDIYVNILHKQLDFKNNKYSIQKTNRSILQLLLLSRSWGQREATNFQNDTGQTLVFGNFALKAAHI